MIIKKNKIKKWEEQKQEQSVLDVQQEEKAFEFGNASNFVNSEVESEEDVTQIEPVLPKEPEIDLSDRKDEKG